MKKFICALMAAVMLLALTACGGDSSSASVDEKTKLTLATSADFPPYEYIADDGSYAGIDVEIASAIAKKLGLEIEVVNMDFNAIVSSVSTGKYDMGMAGLTVTDERLQQVDFSNSYATGVQVLIVKEDSPITSVDDLYADGADYVVGAQISTTGDIYFSDDIADGLTTCTIQEFKSGADAILALSTGKIDCVIIDNEPAKSFVAANEGLKILDGEYAVEDYAICIQKGNTELTEKINTALSELTTDGTIAGIVEKYIPTTVQAD